MRAISWGELDAGCAFVPVVFRFCFGFVGAGDLAVEVRARFYVSELRG
jgi:hypothetical protein